MEKCELFNALGELLPGVQLEADVDMSQRTSFRVGGPADVLLTAQTTGQLAGAIRFAKDNGVPYMILGGGTNILAPDEGFRALVITLGDCLSGERFMGNSVLAGAGLKLALLARDCIQKGFAGLETLGGVPGQVGGGVIMNAGAYGRSVSDSICEVTFLDADQRLMTTTVSQRDFGYRTSSFWERGDTVISAKFALRRDTDGNARKKFDECAKARREKQPINIPSAGSVFKRPNGCFAGQLIEAAGLKGETQGGAQVSPLHAGFIVNNGGATACDVLELIKRVRKRVFEHSGVMLQPEIRLMDKNADIIRLD